MLSGVIIPVSAFKSVDFPEPFAPHRLALVFSDILNCMSFNISLSPNESLSSPSCRFLTFFSSMSLYGKISLIHNSSKNVIEADS